MPKTFKAGVIGCGAIAQAMHLPGYANCPGVELVCGCDPDRDRLREIQERYPAIRTYRDYAEMLANEPLDVVSIASPNCYHADQAVAALDRDVHVLLEKPVALTMQEVVKIKRAVKKSSAKLIVGFTHRFKRGNHKIQKYLAEGKIGQPLMFRMRLAHTGPIPGWAKSDWFHRPKLAGGGAMLDMGIHAIDQALWHMGPAKTVQAYAGTLRKKIKLDDTAVILIEFAKTKALGYLEVGWSSPAGFSGMEIMGDNGCIVEDYAGSLTLTTGQSSPDLNAPTRMKTRVVDRQPNTGGWSNEVHEVVKAFRRGDDLGCSIDAGGAALAVALAAYESARTGRRVKVAAIK